MSFAEQPNDSPYPYIGPNGTYMEFPGTEDLPPKVEEASVFPWMPFGLSVAAAAGFGVATVAGTNIRAGLDDQLADYQVGLAEASAAADAGEDHVDVQLETIDISGNPDMVHSSLAHCLDRVTGVDDVLSPLTWLATIGTAAITLNFMHGALKASGSYKFAASLLLPGRK